MIRQIRQYINNHRTGEGSYRHVLTMAIPLILSTGSWSIQQFVDRMFLTWYSPDAVAASLSSGIINYTLMCLFIGTASYTGTFVAQYFGAGREDHVGPVVWQGIYVSLAGGVVMALTIPLARPFFLWIGHAPKIVEYEVIFYQVLCLGAAPAVAASALSGFFSGLGKTWTVMWVSFVTTLVTVVADYLLIFGNYGFPRWGVAGAATATVLSGVANFLIFVFLFFRKNSNQQFHTINGWRLDRELFGRLVKFGFPSGVQLFLDGAGFAVFILLMGRIGSGEFAASTIAFNINTFAFMPMFGLGIAVSVLVGQYLGQNRPDLAQKSTSSGFHISMAYMTGVACLYVFTPNIFISPFISRTGELEKYRPMIVTMLQFVAVYSLFDSMNIIFSSALKGAGDTRFVMFLIVAASWLILVIPSYIAVQFLRSGIMTLWYILTAYVILLGFSFLFRFLGGKWKSMRVIKEPVPQIPHILPESPAGEMN
jgi:multidrug resistance protein, MATE family